MVVLLKAYPTEVLDTVTVSGSPCCLTSLTMVDIAHSVNQ